jgi:hypothetical protein
MRFSPRTVHSGVLMCVVFVAASLWSPPARSDSPLTSADFHQAYLDLPQVRKAAQVRLLDDDLADYILSPGTSYDETAAVINALGWDTEGKDNHVRLLRRLKVTDRRAFDRFRAGKGSSRVLFAVGYLWAMDDYFETRRTEALLWQARRQAPEFFAIALVHALVVAQSEDVGRWCEVFRGPRATLAKYPNGLEMRRSAVKIVLDYTDIYADECK